LSHDLAEGMSNQAIGCHDLWTVDSFKAVLARSKRMRKTLSSHEPLHALLRSHVLLWHSTPRAALFCLLLLLEKAVVGTNLPQLGNMQLHERWNMQNFRRNQMGTSFKVGR